MIPVRDQRLSTGGLEDRKMSDEYSDYSKGLSGEPPPFGASNSHWSGWSEYQNRISSFTISDVPANASASGYTSCGISGDFKFLAVLSLIESGTVGWQLGSALWGDGVILIAFLFTMAYFYFVADVSWKVWLLVPRLAFWSFLVARAVDVFSIEIYWKCAFILLVDFIVVYNAYNISREEQMTNR
jgi:hypothetical protein